MHQIDKVDWNFLTDGET